MMMKVAGLVAVCAVAISEPASACTIPPPPPQLQGETVAAYEARLARLYREREMARAQARITRGLADAALIFVARDTAWAPSYRQRPLPKARPGQPPPSIPRPIAPVIAYPAPSYFKPIDWIRGSPVSRIFRVNRSDTSCGPMSLGDTSASEPGNLYLFFARKGPVSEATLIDAIALDSIDHPALTAFVAKYRKRPTARP